MKKLPGEGERSGVRVVMWGDQSSRGPVLWTSQWMTNIILLEKSRGPGTLHVY